ncbi:unnamed protein product [Lactuca virosa]|uniref:Uncharacterized protein n=1 Tax=Lactuca virosa TaxID=75947 RepID=A0AAU9MXQ9_9ASTR|nr:unnamed protein product [Lactuca virosa]
MTTTNLFSPFLFFFIPTFPPPPNPPSTPIFLHPSSPPTSPQFNPSPPHNSTHNSIHPLPTIQSIPSPNTPISVSDFRSDNLV